jgi:uncharacterized membrane protein
MSASVRRIGLGIVLASLAGTLAVGLAEKAPCASGQWGDLRQYRMLCYSDIVPLYTQEGVDTGRLPFIQSCPPEVARCDEYPVLTMYAMWVAAGPAETFSGFFYANAFLLAIAAFIVAISLYMLSGPRALYFSLAPTLLIYAFVNWDLYAVAAATVGTLAFLRGRDRASGALLGIGAAFKMYPALLLIPFMAERFRRREPDGAVHLFWWAIGTWLATNVVFMLWAPESWSLFFRFNEHRPADWDSLWFIPCQRLQGGTTSCGNTGFINEASFVLFVGMSTVLWSLRVRRYPDTPRWTLAFPILITFLLTNKVYSPQYSLWLLPWFALVLPDLRLFLWFEATDVAVFVTRFAWFGSLDPDGGWTHAVTVGIFEAAVIARAVVLVVILATYTFRRERIPDRPEPAMIPA